MITPQQAIELMIEHRLTVGIALSKRMIKVYSTDGNYNTELFPKDITIKDYCESIEKSVAYFTELDQ